MEQSLTHPWPTWKWPNLCWLLTIFGAIVGAFVFIDMTKLSGKQRVELALATTLAPFGFVVLGYACRLFATAGRRVLSYDRLYQVYVSKDSELNSTKVLCSELLRDRASLRAFAICYTFVQRDTGYVALARKQGIKLHAGQKLFVVNNDGTFHGTFEVISSNNNTEYHAKSLGDMDAMWLGWAKSVGAAHSDAPVGSTALLLNTNGENDE